MGPMGEPRDRTEEERPADHRRSAPPVALTPRVKRICRVAARDPSMEVTRRDQTPEQSPARPGPGLEHPADRSTPQRQPEPDSHDRTTRQPLTQGHQQPLSGGILRGVSRGMQDVEGLEVFPHGMRRLTHPPVGKRVGGKQIAELVVNVRQRWTDLGEGHADRQRQAADQDEGPPTRGGDPGKLANPGAKAS